MLNGHSRQDVVNSCGQLCIVSVEIQNSSAFISDTVPWTPPLGNESSEPELKSISPQMVAVI
jgi:hypothetical protein